MITDNSSIPVQIETQDKSGVWRPVFITTNNSQRIVAALRETQKQYRGQRVRAVEVGSKRIIDIL